MKMPSPLQIVFMVIVAALLAGGIYLAVVVVKQVRAVPGLEAQLEQVEAEIAWLQQTYDIPALEVELADLEDELEGVPFPIFEGDENPSVDVFDLIENAVEEAHVYAYTYSEGAPTAEIIGDSDIEYQAFPIGVTAEATTLPRLYTFLEEVEDNAPYETLVIDDIEIVHTVGTEPESWSISFEITVYAQPAEE